VKGAVVASFFGAWLLIAVAGFAQTERIEQPGTARETASLYGAGSGRLEVVAETGADGRRLAFLGEEAWEVWRDPFGLPDRWPAAVTVRLVPEDRWTAAEPAWRVVGEAAGIVTVWIKGGGEPGAARDRRWLMALAEGVLHRQALSLGVTPERLWMPDWLIAGGAEAVLTTGERVALLDSWRQAARRGGRMPGLMTLLTWKGGLQRMSDGDDARVLASFAAWQWLRAESGNTAGWRRLVAGLIAGAPPRLALNAAYGDRFRRMPVDDLELIWQISAAAFARLQSLPSLSAAESRRWLDQLDRLVVIDAEAEATEKALRLSEVWAERRESVIARTRAERTSLLTGGFARVHPFYRNAAGSLGRVWLAQDSGKERAWVQAREEWRADKATGRELERASAALLDEASR
jgi:hypothetical protein